MQILRRHLPRCGWAATRALPPGSGKTQPVQMQTVTVGPISNGDAARLYALCGDLGLVESGLYHAAYTEV